MSQLSDAIEIDKKTFVKSKPYTNVFKVNYLRRQKLIGTEGLLNNRGGYLRLIASNDSFWLVGLWWFLAFEKNLVLGIYTSWFVAFWAI